jgi:hypothetical protein
MLNRTIKFRPILFATPMVRQLLHGTKTQTRRIVKKKYSNTDIVWHEKHSGKTKILVELQNDAPEPIEKENGSVIYHLKAYHEIECPYEVGDILWVRETFYKTTAKPLEGGFFYKASVDENWNLKWKPSIFMPKEACRIFLKLISIRTERLQDISESDAQAEGAIQHEAETDWLTAKYGFEMIWETINGKESWVQNPYVFVYEFEKIEKPLDFIV